MAGGKASGAKLTMLQRREFALRARQQGSTYAEIGDALGISMQAAHKMVIRALHTWTRRVEAEADALRALELSRLEAMHEQLWRRFMAGDMKLAQPLMQVMDRRIRLLGIAPDQTVVIEGEAERLPDSPDAETAARNLLAFLESRGKAVGDPPTGDDRSGDDGGPDHTTH